MAIQVTASSAQKYLAPPERQGIALCLSGGGYRAALFHSGAIRRLNELGVLGQITQISSVSGGSIFAAHLFMCLGRMRNGCFADYERDVAAPFRAFVKNDIRTSPALCRLLPWEWANGGAQAEALQEKYDQLLTKGTKLKDLPPNPTFHFCSTDLAYGVDWSFSRNHAGDWQAGYMDPAAAGEIPLAKAVAASSCFPPVFKPMALHLKSTDLPQRGNAEPGPDRDGCIEAIALTDGGVYDNMGLEPVWKRCQTLIVSDGGKPFTFSRGTILPSQLYRMTDVMGNQAEAIRKRWLIASYLKQVYGGVYWGIGSATADYPTSDVPGYSSKLAKEVIATIRTDMDKFSDDEAAVLETHGYCLAEAGIKSHVSSLYRPLKLVPPSQSFWPDPQDITSVEEKVRNALADSSHIHLFGH